MEDKELLEMAAKAYCRNARMFSESEHYRKGFMDGWNPLENDGAALRLAVDLGMNIEITDTNIYASCRGNFSEPAKPDAFAATRRAIVRAAAEIGKSMP